jgi:hypothetical protein
MAEMVALWNETMLNNSLGAFYESLIILSWACFETLAEDLWEAAVNARPSKLATGKVSVDGLKMYGFDVEYKMGTLLKNSDKRSFRTLWDIRDAYSDTFKDQGQCIASILDDVELQHTAAVRNVLIHKGGKIDVEYLKQVDNVPNAVKGKDRVGTKYPLSGKITSERCEAAIASAAKLIKAVHAWIICHPE